MIFLSRLILDPRSRAVRRDLSNCHDLHRTILSGFPHHEDARNARESFGVLYRVDADDPRGLTVLVQSAVGPDWTILQPGYLLDLMDQNPCTKPVTAVYDALTEGQELVFRLVANPTKRLSSRGSELDKLVGKRVELQREDEQQTWLARKGETCGFELLTVWSDPSVPDVRLIPSDKRRGTRAGSGTMSFGSVRFEGRLESSPRAWGWTVVCDGSGLSKLIVPTGVGVDRS